MPPWSRHLLLRETDKFNSAWPQRSCIPKLYGDQYWIQDLDLVDELEGHRGCVNALSWSTSGHLLASGSDDLHLNLYAYQGAWASSPGLSFQTTVETGHTANIFSVKFMPHSADRTLITCAGDSTVRVFDIERSGTSPTFSQSFPQSQPNPSRPTARNIFRGVQYLTAENTNTRVYRSHTDRVKRIVTESSPFLFLTCSEDGEVHQFDLRKPSSAYPSERHHEYRPRGLTSLSQPLISYKEYDLELNTISCSPSQPHYIALGGGHLHCFLHDRRMIGRNLDHERGALATPPPLPDTRQDAEMHQATRCVRRFAPHRGQKEGRREGRHVTACKISDTCPNEMIVSWSGGHIYAFDLVQPLDSSLQNSDQTAITSKGLRSSGSREGTRKSSILTAHQRRSARIASKLVTLRKIVFSASLRDSLPATHRRQSQSQQEDPQASSALVKSVSQDLALAQDCLEEMQDISRHWRYPVNPSRETVLVQNTLRANRRAAQRFVDFTWSIFQTCARQGSYCYDPNGVISQCASSLEIPRESEGSLVSKSQYFSFLFLEIVLLWLNGGPDTVLKHFQSISRRSNSASCFFSLPSDATLKSIDVHLIPHLLSFASNEPITSIERSRFLHDQPRTLFDSQKDAVRAFSKALRIPFNNAPDRAIECDRTQTSSAGADPLPQPAESASRSQDFKQDRISAVKFWLLGVSRSLLMLAGRGINYSFVDSAFGGLGRRRERSSSIDSPRSEGENIANSRAESDDENGVVDPLGRDRLDAFASRDDTRSGADTQDVLMDLFQDRGAADAAGHRSSSSANDLHESLQDTEDLRTITSQRIEMSDADQSLHTRIRELVDSEMMEGDLTLLEAQNRHIVFDDDDDEIDVNDDSNTDRPNGHGDAVVDADYDNDDDNVDDDYDDEHEQQEEEEESEAGSDSDMTPENFGFESVRTQKRENVESHVPLYSHTRSYRGHCNVKTFKDCNFFGLNDEYVVSGSDDGNLFIWDRQNCKIVNILEGDMDVVNVVQGHPYEPTLAVSGIDSTIKIFSPDARSQLEAKNGINVSRARHLPPLSVKDQHIALNTYDEDGSIHSAVDENAHIRERCRRYGLSSKRRLKDSYLITSQNELHRQEGARDSFISRGMLAQLVAQVQASRRDQDDDPTNAQTDTRMPNPNCVPM